eukprot:Opistho-2@94880
MLSRAAKDIPKMDLIDIGANLAHRTFGKNIDNVVNSSRAAGVHRIVATGTGTVASKAVVALARRYPGTIFATCGVHPHEARLLNENAFAELSRLAASPEVVAVGECGLDFDRDFSPRDVQERAFESQIRLACQLRKPLFLHERAAHERFCEVFSRFPPESLPRCVVHCFTGTEQELDRYLSMGFYIGITGWICDDRRGLELQRIVRKVPLDKIMIETDAPFLTPRTIKPRPSHCEPRHLTAVLETTSDCMGLTVAELAAHTTRNAEVFFALGGKST